MKRLAIVVPCYNEEEVLSDSVKTLTDVLTDLIARNLADADSFLLLVNDGSKDRTWEIMQELHKDNKYVHALKLAGNVGHQNALMAGLTTAMQQADVSISIDADLQDDVAVIADMMTKYNEGCDIVFGVRSSRKTDSWFKRTTAQGFYKLMRALGVNSIYNHADFRLMSKRALMALSEYGERNLFLRGIVASMGYKTDVVTYERKERMAGESKYPFRKMVSFAMDGVTSFSVKPMSMIMYCGLIMVFITICAAIYALVSYFTGHVTSGWTSLILSLWFIGGMILFALGLVGLYVGKIYTEVKRRPRYFIECELGENADEQEN